MSSNRRNTIKLRIENLTYFITLLVILLAGCSGCAQKNTPHLKSPVDITQDIDNHTGTTNQASGALPTEFYPPEKPYADITITGEQPPFPYHGNPIFWVPDIAYQTTGTPGYEQTFPVISYSEKHREYLQALQEYTKETGEPVPGALERKISEQVFGKDMNFDDAVVEHLPPLDAAKCLLAIGRRSSYAKRMAQRALNENPNDFHTLLIWTEAQTDDEAIIEGYRQLLKMRPTSAYVSLMLAECIKHENSDENIQLYKKAIQYAPQEEIGTHSHLNNFSIHIRDGALSQLGSAYFWNDEKEKAIETYKHLAEVTLYEETRKFAQERIDEIKGEIGLEYVIFVDPDELYD